MASEHPPLPERRKPTHTLVVEIPLHIAAGQTFYFDPLRDALRIALSLSRLSTEGLLCDDPQVMVREAPG